MSRSFLCSFLFLVLVLFFVFSLCFLFAPRDFFTIFAQAAMAELQQAQRAAEDALRSQEAEAQLQAREYARAQQEAAAAAEQELERTRSEAQLVGEMGKMEAVGPYKRQAEALATQARHADFAEPRAWRRGW